MFGLVLVGLAAALGSPVVPLPAQRAIGADVPPRLAYVPTFAPAGYHYDRWMKARTRPRGLTIWFGWRHMRDAGIGFNVADGCPEFGSMMRRFRFGRVTVGWSTTNTNAQAWRCLTNGGRKISFYVSAPGYMLAGAPTPRSLALMIASARALR